MLQRHPEIGHRMLRAWASTPSPRGAPPPRAVGRHRLPGAARGDEIPLGARIIFVADAYDAMTSDRAYRGRLTPREAIEELERCSGAQFDPEIVAAFARELVDRTPALAVAAG